MKLTLFIFFLDFGISKFIGQGSALVAYTSVGRAYDMSPEVLIFLLFCFMKNHSVFSIFFFFFFFFEK